MKKYFVENRWQKIGAVLFALSLLSAAFGWNEVTLGLLFSIGVLDIVLVVLKMETISKWIYRQFPRWGDVVVMISILILAHFLYGLDGFIPVCIGIVVGHLFWR